MLDYAQKELLQKKLEKATAPGEGKPVTEWIERLQAVATEAGLWIHLINWEQAPCWVAWEMVDQACNALLESKLEKAVDARIAQNGATSVRCFE